MPENNIKIQSNNLRTDIQNIADKLLQVKKDYPNSPVLTLIEDRGEVLANLTLAYRHLEDAKMRLGKVIQAVEGSSIYDTANTAIVNGSSPINN